jgi:Tol biopolymer transport system component
MNTRPARLWASILGLMLLAALAAGREDAEPVKGTVRAETDSSTSGSRAAPPTGTILFSSLAPRGWDVYVADLSMDRTSRLTDHAALDYNAALSPDGNRLAFVSERDGNLELYAINRDGRGLKRLTDDFALDDHPAWSSDGKRIAFCSTRQPSASPGQAWNAIYVMNADGSGVRRVSPADAADYSPAWSPRGNLLACASGSGAAGGTDLYVMKSDGSGRKLVVKDGGWPAFSADGESLYFHSKRQGKWGIWRVHRDGSGLERMTADDVEAFTPRASADGKWLVMAVKRGEYRQIERLELASGKLTALTKEPADHWNPSISADGRQVLYHRTAPGFTVPNVEIWGSPPACKFQMLRLAGAFPALAPDGKRLALVSGNFGQLDVMNLDGSGRKNIFSSAKRTVFSLSWAHGGDRIALSHGTAFQGPESKVEIETIAPDGTHRKALTDKAGNNGFPSFSPDGKQLVFRSGRDGHKNLYLMHRDGSGVRRLTEGKWTDTMADWSPSGEWIAFASDRDKNFEIWLIKPDGSGLKKLIGGGGVRHNHPHFSPDSQWIVFTSQRAGLSAEEISLPHQPQPYGDLFAIRLDGSGLMRLTHNGFEEGTPAWSAAMNVKPSKQGGQGSQEY